MHCSVEGQSNVCCSFRFRNVLSIFNALALLPEPKAQEGKNCITFPLLKTNQIGFSCTSAFSRGLIYSNHSLIPSQHHHNLYGMELPSQISFSLLWSYAKNYCLVTTVSVGLVSPANSRKVYYSHTSSHTRLKQALKPFFYRWRERARDIQ